MTWRLIERRGRIEVRIYSGKQTPALYYEVTVTPGEIESNPTGVEAYGFDREVYQEFAESVIIPAIEGKLWDWDCVLAVLEKYLVSQTSMPPFWC